MENKNKPQSVIKSASIVIAVTLLVKILGFVREICMGYAFGTSIESDIYFWAMNVTTVIFMAIATAASSAMLPALKEFKVKNENDKMKKYISKIFTFTLSVSVILALIWIFDAPWFTKLIATKFEGEYLGLATKILQILSVSVVFIVLAYIAKTILQANEKFFMYSFISFPYNILIIIYILFFADKFGIIGLAWVTVIGWLFQFLIQIPVLKKLNVNIDVDFHFKDEEVKKFAILILPLLVSSLIYSINTLVDKSIALNLADGKVAGLNYGYNMYQSIATTIILGISSVLYPKFVEAKVNGGNEQMRKDVSYILKIMSFIALPMMVCFIALNKELVEVAYMRGSFDATSVEFTRWALICYALGTFSYTFQEMLMKVFYSLKDSKTPMITSLISVALNVVLDFALVRVLDYKGLAIATTIAITLNMIMLYIALEVKLGRFMNGRILLTILRSLISLILPVFAAKWITGAWYVSGGSLLMNLIVILAAVLAAGILYFLCSWILQMDETKFIIDEFLKRKNKVGDKND